MERPAPHAEATRTTIAELEGAGYDVSGVIGQGGMGTVYLARHRTLGRDVAIKALSPALSSDPLAMARFDNEMVTMAGLDCPSIATLYDGAVTPSGVPYFVMDYIDGPSLAEKIAAADRPFTIEETVATLRPVAEALDYLHESRGRDPIVHRDVKPENILIADSGAVLTDFGISYISQASRLTVEGIVVGTSMYMAPELYRPGTVRGTAMPMPTPATDNYALALVAYEMLTGTPFYLTMSAEAWRGPRPLEQLIDAPATGVFTSALANNPVKRYPSAVSFIDALEQSVEAPRGGFGRFGAGRFGAGGFGFAQGRAEQDRAEQRSAGGRRPSAARDKRPARLLAALLVVITLIVAAAAVTGVTIRSSTTLWGEGEQRIAYAYPELVSQFNGGSGWEDTVCTAGVRETGQSGKIVCSSEDLVFTVANYGSADNRRGSVNWPSESKFVEKRCFQAAPAATAATSGDGTLPPGDGISPDTVGANDTNPAGRQLYALLAEAPHEGYAVLLTARTAEDMSKALDTIPLCPDQN